MITFFHICVCYKVFFSLENSFRCKANFTRVSVQIGQSLLLQHMTLQILKVNIPYDMYVYNIKKLLKILQSYRRNHLFLLPISLFCQPYLYFSSLLSFFSLAPLFPPIILFFFPCSSPLEKLPINGPELIRNFKQPCAHNLAQGYTLVYTIYTNKTNIFTTMNVHLITLLK